MEKLEQVKKPRLVILQLVPTTNSMFFLLIKHIGLRRVVFSQKDGKWVEKI